MGFRAAARIASEAGKAPDEVVRELVASHLEHDEWFRLEVGKALASLDQGKTVHTRTCAARWTESSVRDWVP